MRWNGSPYGSALPVAKFEIDVTEAAASRRANKCRRLRRNRGCMLRGSAGEKPMSIDAEEAAIRTVIVGALMGHSEDGDRGFDALLAMRQAEAIVKALKIGGYEIKRGSR
jgi:hypothetical protein